MRHHTKIGDQWVQLEQVNPETDCWTLIKYGLTLIAIAISTIGLWFMLG